MRNMLIHRLAGLALGFLAISTSPLAAGEKQSFPEEARKRLDYTIGKWQSKNEYFDKKGKVVKRTTSRDVRSFVIEDRVVEISGMTDGDGPTFRAWEYYDVQEAKYKLTSVNRDGQLWTMKGDLGDEFVWTGSRTRPDGSTLLMRFTHYDMTESSFTARGELSFDGGQTWRVFSRQFLTRIEE